MTKVTFEQQGPLWKGAFRAMGSPCEILIETNNKKIAKKTIDSVAEEAFRIEKKFSRYREDNIIHKINNSNGLPITVDEETAQLLDFAKTLYELSDGLFDITSGVLRTIWSFSSKEGYIPTPDDIAKTLQKIGWHKIEWKSPVLKIQPDMQIDFGGIGKEYAVDRAIQIAKSINDYPCLINFGGDLAITSSRNNNQAWQIGVESISSPGNPSSTVIELYRGALATSGDVNRYLIHNGKRYGHILNPKTGWPILGAPRSVTTAASSCTQAGMLATIAMLHGTSCEQFLQDEEVKFWCLR